MERLGSLPLAIAVAVHEAVRQVLPHTAERLEVKWPNDILIGRKKTCGILVEGEALPDGRHALVIGIGINVAFMPDNPLYPVTCLREQGSSASPEEVFAHLFASMAEVLDAWDRRPRSARNHRAVAPSRLRYRRKDNCESAGPVDFRPLRRN